MAGNSEQRPGKGNMTPTVWKGLVRAKKFSDQKRVDPIRWCDLLVEFERQRMGSPRAHDIPVPIDRLYDHHRSRPRGNGWTGFEYAPKPRMKFRSFSPWQKLQGDFY